MKALKIVGYFILALIGVQVTLVLFAPQYAYDFRHVDEAKAWIGGYEEEYYECKEFYELRESVSDVELALGIGFIEFLSEDAGEEAQVRIERLMEQCYE